MHKCIYNIFNTLNLQEKACILLSNNIKKANFNLYYAKYLYHSFDALTALISALNIKQVL